MSGNARSSSRLRQVAISCDRRMWGRQSCRLVFARAKISESPGRPRPLILETGLAVHSLTARSAYKVEQRGFRYRSFGLDRGLHAVLLLRQVHRCGGHVRISYLADRGLILELEFLRDISRIGNLIFYGPVVC